MSCSFSSLDVFYAGIPSVTFEFASGLDLISLSISCLFERIHTILRWYSLLITTGVDIMKIESVDKSFGSINRMRNRGTSAAGFAFHGKFAPLSILFLMYSAL